MWVYVFFFFFKQKTAYEMRISDWSSDVCSSDLADGALFRLVRAKAVGTDEFGEIGRVVGRRRLHPAHFVEDDGDARLGKLPGGFRPRKAAADDMDCIGHGGGLARVRSEGAHV